MTKQKISREDFSIMSSEIAENQHHEYCEFKCCGEHNAFQDFDVCPVCGMTEDIQQNHNEEVWKIIDDVEACLLDEYRVIDY